MRGHWHCRSEVLQHIICICFLLETFLNIGLEAAPRAKFLQWDEDMDAVHCPSIGHAWTRLQIKAEGSINKEEVGTSSNVNPLIWPCRSSKSVFLWRQWGANFWISSKKRPCCRRRSPASTSARSLELVNLLWMLSQLMTLSLVRLARITSQGWRVTVPATVPMPAQHYIRMYFFSMK